MPDTTAQHTSGGIFCGICNAPWGSCEHSRSLTQPATVGLQGWECPRCRTVHGPFVQRCWCPAPQRTVGNDMTLLTGPRLDVSHPENGGGTELVWWES